MKRILVIDDDTYICKLLENYLAKNGYDITAVYTGNEAIKQINQGSFDLVLSDYRLPDKDGFTILEQARKKRSDLPVIIMTAYKELDTAVRLIKSGAHDYITKPLIPEEVLKQIREALAAEDQPTHSPVTFESDFIKGQSANFREILEHIRIVSPVNLSVIIQGETGSGKEYVARSIHFNSQRKDGPFIAVDCGALPKGVVNSELFGHIKGSFTGATFDKKGYFEQADGGTLFLDEISNLDGDNQVKLLRVLQEKHVNRIGDSGTIPVDVRLIVASNTDLLQEVESGNLREDLYHRLNEFKIHVPPLRERAEDIEVFATEFMHRAARRFEKQVSGFGENVLNVFQNYHWPGNIRELKNVVTRAVLLTQLPVISLEVIPEEVKTRQAIQQNIRVTVSGDRPEVNLKDAAGLAEKEAIIQALVRSKYNKSQAARLLNIDRKTLYNKIKQFNISLIEP